MTSKLPLKAINGSNIGRPAGIPKPSGLQPPGVSGLKLPGASGLKPPGASGLKPPGASGLRPPGASGLRPLGGMGLRPPPAAVKRPASSSPTREQPQVNKRLRQDPKITAKPAVRKPVGPVAKATAPTRATGRPTVQPPTSRLNVTAPKPGVRATTRTTTRPTTKPAAAKPTSAAGGGKNARAAWDYKGRMQDLEATLGQYKNDHERTADRVQQLEAERYNLKGDLQVKEKISSQASEQIVQLNAKIRSLEDELTTSRRNFQQQVSDLEFSKSSLERQRDALDGDLRASQQEVAGLKSTVATLTSANAGNKAELEATQAAGRIKDSTNADLRATVASHETTIEQCQATIREHEATNREHETDRRRLHNVIQELKGNIRVFCRVRPLLGEERLGNDGEISHMGFPDVDNKILELEKVGELAANETLSSLARNGKKYEFAFDRVFGPADSQATVFDEISQLVQSALDGYNVCIFAYGQTGSGKTFTMEGPTVNNPTDRGMIPRAVEQVFMTGNDLKDKGWQYEYEASFLEIYNETIRDLLGNGSVDTKHDIKMVSKESNEILVSNLMTKQVTNEDQVHQLLQKATQNRAVGETKCNERSSRSHSVFRLRLSGINSITEEKSVGMLNLIDLAGSERLKESGAQGARLKETQCINKSLANLGNVIMALANKDSHIPYRNSKLTHLLQNSLGGNSKTLMFVNVNPREDFVGETLCSLRFATKVNACNIGTAQKRQK